MHGARLQRLDSELVDARARVCDLDREQRAAHAVLHNHPHLDAGQRATGTSQPHTCT